jgi:hypothetical protein
MDPDDGSIKEKPVTCELLIQTSEPNTNYKTYRIYILPKEKENVYKFRRQ